MKTLTIAMPVYNTEKYIKRCLDSILIDEIIDDIEIIAVNDGSKDNSLNILNEYKTLYPNTIIVIDKKNGGHGSTINAAFNIARGKYFKVVDSDDWVDSINFVDFVHKLKNYNEDVIVSPYTEEYAYDGSSVLYSCIYNMTPNIRINFDDIKIDDPVKYYFAMASATYKLELLKKCNLSLFENAFYVDMQYNIMPIPFIKTLRYLDRPIYRYFIGRSAQSMNPENLSKNYKDHQKVLKFLIEYYIKFEGKVSKPKKDYMEFMTTSMIYTFFTIVCIQLKDKKVSYSTIKNFDNYLKQKSETLYASSDLYSQIRYSRKLKFINVRFFMGLFMRAFNIIRKVRSK